MTKYVSYITEEELAKEFFRDVRDRYIDQKFLYQGENSIGGFYNLEQEHASSVADSIDYEAYARVFTKLVSEGKRTAFISLGCGDAQIEAKAIKLCKEECNNMLYVGIDTSTAMLENAEKNLASIDIDKVFLHIDMIDNAVKEKIGEVTKDCDHRVFAFIGGTFSNVNQTNVADSLYNTLDEGDTMWIDVRVRNEATMENNMKLFNRYENYLHDGTEKWWFTNLQQLGVPFESGRMNMNMVHEPSVGALRFNFFFTFNEKIVAEIEGNKIHFLPNEKVKLQTIRVYHPETFINFMNEHDFKFVNKWIDGEDGQFIFKK